MLTPHARHRTPACEQQYITNMNRLTKTARGLVASTIAAGTAGAAAADHELDCVVVGGGFLGAVFL